MKNNKKTQQGIGLLELMLTVLVIVSILFIATRYFKTASSQSKVSQAVSQIKVLTKASYQWVEGEHSFVEPDAVSVKNLVNNGFLDTRFLLQNSNPWHGGYLLAPDEKNKNRVVVSLANIPIKSCEALIEMLRDTGSGLACRRSSGSLKYVFVGTF